MDTVALVDRQIDEGWRLVDALAAEGFPVVVAFWGSPYESGRKSLYLATPLRKTLGLRGAVQPVLRTLQNLHTDWLTPTDLTVIDSDTPLVKTVLDYLRRHPEGGSMPPYYSYTGEEQVEEIYVYPLAKVELTIYGIRFPNATQQFRSVNFSFSPHNPTTSLQVGGTCFACEVGIDWQIAAPAGAELVETEFGVRMLRWQLHERPMESSASEVWHLANLGLHGFRILKSPNRPV